MMQIIVFFMLGPVAVFFATCWAVYDPGGSKPEIVFAIAMIASIWSFPISAFLGIVDGCLAVVMSRFLRRPMAAAAGAVFLRAPLTAAAGAMIVQGPLAAPLDRSELRYWSIAFATYAGICSLLSNDWLAARRTDEAGGPTSGP